MVIGNIGIGLFILIIVWILALIVFVVGIKYQNNVAWVTLASVTVFTIILVLLPLENQKSTVEQSDSVGKDYGFIYRITLLTFMILSALIGFAFFFMLHCIEPIRPKAIK